MKKTRMIIALVILIMLCLIGIGVGIYNYFSDENGVTSSVMRSDIESKSNDFGNSSNVANSQSSASFNDTYDNTGESSSDYTSSDYKGEDFDARNPTRDYDNKSSTGDPHPLDLNEDDTPKNSTSGINNTNDSNNTKTDDLKNNILKKDSRNNSPKDSSNDSPSKSAKDSKGSARNSPTKNSIKDSGKNDSKGSRIDSKNKNSKYSKSKDSQDSKKKKEEQNKKNDSKDFQSSNNQKNQRFSAKEDYKDYKENKALGNLAKDSNKKSTKDSRIAESTQSNKEASFTSANNNQTKGEDYDNHIESRELHVSRNIDYTCDIAPECDHSSVESSLVLVSLKNHAVVRAKEELETNGYSARERFLKLWDKTQNSILPKLTSHISNIRDYGLNKARTQRFCNANYYTEVLEDFENGWRDKKGDKSPSYNANYKVLCKNNKVQVNILKNSVKLSKAKYDELDRVMGLVDEEDENNSSRNNSFKNDSVENVQNKKANNKDLNSALESAKSNPIYSSKSLPKCDDKKIQARIIKASFTYHAMTRADEQKLEYGTNEQYLFMNLWNKTQNIIIPKLTSHISNIEDLGISESVRFCKANYYTEVLEDFGHGWIDKKGDKSPKYTIYYNVKMSGKSGVSVEIIKQTF